MVFSGVRLLRAPIWWPSGGWRQARGKEHCRGEPGSSLSGGYAPDSAIRRRRAARSFPRRQEEEEWHPQERKRASFVSDSDSIADAGGKRRRVDSPPVSPDGPEKNASEGLPLTRQGRVATACLATVATLPCLVSGRPSDAFCSGPSGETGGGSTLLLFPPASAIVSESETKDARFLSWGCHSSSS